MFVLSIVALALALLPMLMMARNISLFDRSPSDVDSLGKARSIPVNVLIPARNEAASIGHAIESILDTTHPQIELLILDDHSEDDTQRIVQSFVDRDQRVRLLQSNPLPAGWNGKQHACWQLAQASQHQRLLFLDADVRLTKDAIIRCVAEMERRNVELVSGFPFQETGTLAERMLIPLMHFVLLGFLPIARMRATKSASLAAGCGQLFFAKRDAYFAMGGHAKIFDSRHDGIKLPRAFRNAGFMTDIFDASDLARCRMYMSSSQVVRGLLKNATEGIANVRLIIPFSILLLGGSVMPLVLLLVVLIIPCSVTTIAIILAAAVVSFAPRLQAAIRFRQSLIGVVLHPIAVLWFVSLQWIAMVRAALGMKTKWRGRM